jgi:hypothetical protein
MVNVRNGWKADIAMTSLACHQITMDAPAITLASQRSPLRDLLPFYSLDMVLFSAALLGATFTLMLWLDPPAAPFVTACGFLGAAGVDLSARPSYIDVSGHQSAVLVALLERSKYHYLSDMDYWVPPLPRWLRWKWNYVQFSANENSVRVAGPANVLRVMLAKL